MLTLQIFGFKALWSPYFLLFLLVLTGIYFLITVKYRGWFKNSEPLERRQGFLFVLFIFLLYTVKGSPLDLMAHLMFYVHMIQMAFLVLIIPPLFIWGIPQWIWRSFFKVKGVRKVFILFTKPIMALLCFNGFFSFYHVPLVFDHVMQNEWMHAGYAILLFIVAIFMWWPLVNELPEFQTLTGIKKVGYIFVDGILLTPACALIIFADTPMYLTYSDPHAWGEAMRLCVGNATFSSLNLSSPQIFSSMSLINDQQLGGVLMKIIQEIIYGFMLARAFFEWYRKDQAESERDISQNVNPTLVE